MKVRRSLYHSLADQVILWQFHWKITDIGIIVLNTTTLYFLIMAHSIKHCLNTVSIIETLYLKQNTNFLRNASLLAFDKLDQIWYLNNYETFISSCCNLFAITRLKQFFISKTASSVIHASRVRCWMILGFFSLMVWPLIYYINYILFQLGKLLQFWYRFLSL